MEATRNTMKEIERTIGGLYNSTLQEDTVCSIRILFSIVGRIHITFMNPYREKRIRIRIKIEELIFFDFEKLECFIYFVRNFIFEN